MSGAVLTIDGRPVGEGHPAYIVAELSANHAQRYDQAVELIHAAREAGADAVKLQTYTPDTLTIRSPQRYFRIEGGTPWDGQTLYDLYRHAYTPWEWQPKLNAVAKRLGITLFSTAYDLTAVDFLEEMGVPVHKVASFELPDLPLIETMARTGKPLILSTGMASLEEIQEAMQAARNAGAGQVMVLKCTSAYPAPPEEMNLRAIPQLAQRFQVPVGLSDHTLGATVAVAAVALGARMIEKHLTLSRSAPSADRAFSLEPNEFKAMVEAVRLAEQALGSASYQVGRAEAKSLIYRRSLFAVEDVKAGDILSENNVRSIRPGHGLPPKFLKQVAGRRAVVDLPRGTPLDWAAVGGPAP